MPDSPVVSPTKRCRFFAPKPTETLLTSQQAASFIGVRRETVWLWAQQGKLRVAERKQGRAYFLLEDLLAVLRAALGAGLGPELLKRRVSNITPINAAEALKHIEGPACPPA